MISHHLLLAAYDEQLRGVTGDGQGVVDFDGPLARLTGGHRGFVTAPTDLGASGYGLTDAEIDQLISRTISHFQRLGQAFEWKTRSHDLPADLPDRLLAAGFVAEPAETVMIGAVAGMPAPTRIPGVSLRRSQADDDMTRVADLHTEVWGYDCSWLGTELRGRIRKDQTGTAVFLAEDDRSGRLVAAAWLELAGRDFVGLWGGSTLAGYRGRGIYRNLVARRAQLAAELGRRWLHVDASAASAPILARLGLQAVTTTTPYVWSPDGSSPDGSSPDVWSPDGSSPDVGSPA